MPTPTGILFQNPLVKPLSTNGLQQAFCTATFYLTGTTTLATICADGNLTTPLANPLTADASGTFPAVYLDSTVTYRVILKTQAGVTFEDVDPYVVSSPPITFPIPVSKGGTNATTAGGALANLGLIDISTEITISAATTLDGSALGHAFVIQDSASPANYTVNLPSGAAVGSMIQLRVSNSATKLFTIAGVDFGIDGDPNRVLWRGESCLLVREAANWTKIGGHTIPFRGCLQRTASQSIAAGSTWVVAAMQTEVGDPTGLKLCFDSVNGRFAAPRRGGWQFNGYLSHSATVATAPAVANAALSLNITATPSTVPTTIANADYPPTTSREVLTVPAVLNLTAGQFVELLGRIVAGGGGTVTSPVFEYVGGVIVPSLSYAEIPLW